MSPRDGSSRPLSPARRQSIPSTVPSPQHTAGQGTQVITKAPSLTQLRSAPPRQTGQPTLARQVVAPSDPRQQNSPQSQASLTSGPSTGESGSLPGGLSQRVAANVSNFRKFRKEMEERRRHASNKRTRTSRTPSPPKGRKR